MQVWRSGVSRVTDIRKVLPKPHLFTFANPYRTAAGMSKEREYLFLSHSKNDVVA